MGIEIPGCPYAQRIFDAEDKQRHVFNDAESLHDAFWEIEGLQKHDNDIGQNDGNDEIVKAPADTVFPVADLNNIEYSFFRFCFLFLLKLKFEILSLLNKITISLYKESLV